MTIPCKVCGGESRPITKIQYRIPEVLLVSARCTKCGLAFVANALTDEQLAVAYGALNDTPYYKSVAETTRRKFQRTADDLDNLPKSAAILDAGTGNGAFALYLRERGFTNVAVHEIPGIDLDHLHDFGIETYRDFDMACVPSGKFAAITALDVAEHVRVPSQFFENCARVLKDGGILYVHTPMVTRLDRLMQGMCAFPIFGAVGRVWQDGRTSIYHLQNYTRPSFDHLLRECGLRMISLTQENELSWPVSKYFEVYVCKKLGLPRQAAKLLAIFGYPLIATNWMNPNKGILLAIK